MERNLLQQNSIFDANIAVLGEGAVGKTSITVRYLKDRFDPGYVPSVKQEYIKQYRLDDGQVGTVQLLDTGGMEEYEGLFDQWIRCNDGFLLVYAIDNYSSFLRIPTIIQSIRRIKQSNKIPIMIVGNKSDLVNDRRVNEEQAKQLLDYKTIKFIETSALKNDNCKKCVEDCIKLVLKRRKADKDGREEDANEENKQKVVCDVLFNLCNLI